MIICLVSDNGREVRMGSKGPAKPVFASPTVLETTVAGSVIEGLVTRCGWEWTIVFYCVQGGLESGGKDNIKQTNELLLRAH